MTKKDKIKQDALKLKAVWEDGMSEENLKIYAKNLKEMRENEWMEYDAPSYEGIMPEHRSLIKNARGLYRRT